MVFAPLRARLDGIRSVTDASASDPWPTLAAVPPLRTAIIDEHEIDTAGVSAVLGRFDDQIRLVDLASPTIDPPDVILYGMRERHAWHDADLHLLLRAEPATVVVIGWGPDAPQVRWALSCKHSPNRGKRRLTDVSSGRRTRSR